MYAVTGLIFLFTVGDVQPRTRSTPDDVIWYPIEDYKNGYSSSYGNVYLTTTSYGFGRRGRSVQGDASWNGFLGERDTSNDPIVFPIEEDIVESCELSCPRTPEYNPVCGSDGRNYHNMATLKCSQLCGNGVRFAHYGTCGRGLPLIFRPTPRPPRRRLDDVSRHNW